MTNGARLAAIGARMAVDHWTVEVVTQFERNHISTILLKGPAVARWLYDDPADRGYADADLLVRRDDLPSARTVLTECGFGLVGPALEAPWTSAAHAETWFRDADHAAVDLHRCLHGTERLDDEVLFDAIWSDRDHLAVHDHDVSVPSTAWRLLHLVLHLQPKDNPGSRAWRDVVHALDRLDVGEWRAAAALAAELDLLDTMGPLLRLVDGGGDMADVLDLPVEPGPELVRHHRRHAPGLVRFGYRIRERGVRGIPRTVRMAVAPPPARVAASYPLAQRGRTGLAAAYAWRVARIPVVVARGVRHQRSQRTQRRLR